MGKFDNYSYAKTLEMFEGWYDNDTENVNYAQVLIGMKDCTNIDDCIKVYKRVYNKYLALFKTTGKEGHKSFDEDLNKCLNENLLRLMEVRNSNLSQEFALECLTNMRQCDNLKQYQKKWNNIIAPLKWTLPTDNIIKSQEEYEKARDEYLYGHFQVGTNGYNRVRKSIVDNIKTLKSHGYRVLPYDVTFFFDDPNELKWLLIGGGIILLIVIILGVGIKNFFSLLFGFFLIFFAISVMLYIIKWAQS